MITNTELKNTLKKEGKELSEQDLNIIRNLFVKLGNIEYQYHKNKKTSNNCSQNKILEISNCGDDEVNL